MTGSRSHQAVVVASLVMASLAVGHELIYLFAHGAGADYARAMQEGGHDRYWTSFLLTVFGVSLVLSIIACRQILRLQRQASLARAGRLSIDDGDLGFLSRLTRRLFLFVSAGTTLAFFAQENLETLAAGHPLPGLDVISGEHAIALPVVAVVSLLVALVGALFQWGRHVLVARLRRSAEPVRQHAPRVSRPAATTVPSSVTDVRSHGLRAPPTLAPSSA